MFTGIVEEIGTVARLGREGTGYTLVLNCKKVLEGVQEGDSIAVNGVCLTVTNFTDSQFTVGLSPETRVRTNLEGLRTGSEVHLERAMTASSRMGGHFVQGHVDGTGEIIDKRPDEDALWIRIKAAPELLRYIVPKGFVTLDGVSLTVVGVTKTEFTITLVAYTQIRTMLAEKPVGYSVNIETDVLGKYMEKMIVLTQDKRDVEEDTFPWEEYIGNMEAPKWEKHTKESL